MGGEDVKKLSRLGYTGVVRRDLITEGNYPAACRGQFKYGEMQADNDEICAKR